MEVQNSCREKSKIDVNSLKHMTFPQNDHQIYTSGLHYITTFTSQTHTIYRKLIMQVTGVYKLEV